MNPSIALRAYRESDHESVGELFNDPEVVRFVGDGQPVAIDEKPTLFDRTIQKYQTDPTFCIWAIEESDQYIGHAELKRRSGRTEYELIYMLQRQCWGRGIGTEIVDCNRNGPRNECRINRHLKKIRLHVGRKNFRRVTYDGVSSRPISLTLVPILFCSNRF